jgi:hypothetical protein
MLPLLTAGHNFFYQDEKWREHNLILGLGSEYKFTDRLKASFFISYIHRWIKARYSSDFYDTYWHDNGANPKGTERYRASDSCTASDLAVRGAISYNAMENLQLRLSGGMIIPLSDVDLDFDGNITGANWTTNSWLTYAYDDSSRNVDQKAVHFGGGISIIWFF